MRCLSLECPSPQLCTAGCFCLQASTQFLPGQSSLASPHPHYPMLSPHLGYFFSRSGSVFTDTHQKAASLQTGSPPVCPPITTLPSTGLARTWWVPGPSLLQVSVKA